MELDEFIELVKEQQGIDLSGVLTTADKIGRPQQALDREAYDDFMKRNPMMDGGRMPLDQIKQLIRLNTLLFVQMF